jgi:hypothetical protein
MSPIGASEFKSKTDTIIVGAEGGGVPAQLQCVAQFPVGGAKALHLKNMGDEDVAWEVLVRGETITITGESIAALQVGATDRFQGLLANRRVLANSVTIVDAGGATQTVTDDGDGNLIGDVDPNGVNTIDYETGQIDFTFAAAFVGPGVTADYQHNGWQSFGTQILGTIVQGGGEADYTFLPGATALLSDNFADGIRGNHTLGLMAYSTGQGSMLRVAVDHTGEDTYFKLETTARFRNLNSPLTEA